MCRASHSGPGQEAESGSGQQRAGQVPAAEPPQAGESISEVMIFDD
jgi:hypothetical protein